MCGRLGLFLVLRFLAAPGSIVYRVSRPTKTLFYLPTVNQIESFALIQAVGVPGVVMSMTYHDKLFMAPAAKRKQAKPEPVDDQGIGRSPGFVPGWWIAGTAVFYVGVALICIFLLT